MEVKTAIFRREPPGDRWRLVPDDGQLFGTLTDALEYYFQRTSIRQYYIDAGAGYIYKVTEEQEPEPEIKRYSIYD